MFLWKGMANLQNIRAIHFVRSKEFTKLLALIKVNGFSFMVLHQHLMVLEFLIPRYNKIGKYNMLHNSYLCVSS